MSLAAYPKGLEQLKQTIAWKDAVAALLGNSEYDLQAVDNPRQKSFNKQYRRF
ncbi:hypothetical protein P4050_00395 [Pseudomonas aeruginosa]|nr:hypothetical protein [Pseudomonas aeruginosa]